MPDDNQDELMSKFIEKLTDPEGKLIPGILDHVHEQVEKSISGLKEKNDELLGKLVATKKERDDFAAMLGAQTKPKETGDIWLTSEQARDPQAYRKARAQAQERGVEVKIEGRHARD